MNDCKGIQLINCARLLLILLMIVYFIPAGAFSQNLSQEVFKTFSDGKPEIVHFYIGEKRVANKVKTEKYDQKGRKVLVENYKDGKLHGKRSEWYHGSYNKLYLSRENNYHMGKFHGRQMEWSSADKVRKEFNYSMGKPDGKQIERFDETLTRFELNYKNGRPEGIQKEWFDSGSMKYEMNFVNGQPDGLQRIWDYSGDPREQVWKDGIFTLDKVNSGKKLKEEYTFDLDTSSLSLDYNYFNSTGYRSLLRTTTFHENGKPATEQTKGKNRWYKEWHANGQLKQEGPGQSFDQVGKWVEYHENGQKAAEGKYDNRKKLGLWKNWNEKGWLVSETTYEWQGVIESIFYDYYPDGKKRSAGNIYAKASISMGYKDGNWTYWTPEGKKWREESYKPGPYSGNRPFIKEFTEWTPDGKVKLKGSDGKATHYYYNSAGSKEAELQLVYKKTRGRHEFLKDGELKINDNYEEKRGGGDVNGYAFEEGFPIQLDVFYSSGKTRLTHRFCKKCSASKNEAENLRRLASGLLHGEQEGWYENGQHQYSFQFSHGCMSGEQKEWRSDGSPIFHLFYGEDSRVARAGGKDECGSFSTQGTYTNSNGKTFDYQIEWTPKSLQKAQQSGDYSLIEAKPKSKKILEIEGESMLQTFLKSWAK